MKTRLRSTGSTGAARTRLRKSLAMLACGMMVSGCAQLQTTGDSGAERKSAITVHSSDLATAARSDPATIAVRASCPREGYPFVSLLTGVTDWTTAVGKIINPRAPEESELIAESNAAPAMVYGEFDAEINQVLAGPHLEKQVSLSFQGGKTANIVTEIGTESQSAWAEDGSFIGLIRADTGVPTGWIADMLPVVDGRVVFPDRVGCFEPAGLQDVDERSVSVLVFDNGTVAESSGLFPTASLDEITRSIGH